MLEPKQNNGIALNVKPLFVKLKAGCLQLTSLRKMFGSGLNTSRTYPRRFALDLSSFVHEFLAQYVDFGAEPFAEPSLIVSCEVIDNEAERKGALHSFVW